MAKAVTKKNPPPKRQGLIGMDHGRLRQVEGALARAGRNGDELIAHISPEEAMLLEHMGGAGTRNPRTGLLEFWGLGGGISSGGHGDAGDGSGGGGGISKGSGPSAGGAAKSASVGEGHVGGYGGGGGISKDTSAPQKGGYAKTAKGAAGGLVGVSPDANPSGGYGAVSGSDTASTLDGDKSFLDRAWDAIANGGWGSIVGGIIGSIAGGPFGGLIGSGLGGLVEAGMNGPSEKDNSAQGGDTSGGSTGGAADGNGSADIGNAGGGVGRGDSLNDVIAKVAARQNQQQAQNPVTPAPTPAQPLAQPGLIGISYPTLQPGTGTIPGYVYNGRFGPGRVSPISWG